MGGVQAASRSSRYSGAGAIGQAMDGLDDDRLGSEFDTRSGWHCQLPWSDAARRAGMRGIVGGGTVYGRAKLNQRVWKRAQQST